MLPKGFEGVKAIIEFVVESIFIHRFQKYPLQDYFCYFVQDLCGDSEIFLDLNLFLIST